MKKDYEVLRELGKIKAELADRKVNEERIEHWTAVNDLETEKPTLFICQEPWHEMNIDDELTLRCEDDFCRQLEMGLRHEIYTCKHYNDDRVVSPYIVSPLIINDSDFGIEEISDLIKLDENTGAPSRHFHVQIKDMDDIEKIKDPIISLNEKETQRHLELRQEIFSGILDVKQIGSRGWWFTPWDYLIRWTGVQEALMDLILRPEYVDKLVERYVDASMCRMKQYKELGFWASNNNSANVGSGGYGYTKSLEKPDNYLKNAPTNQMWGCGNAQIFSEVSPEMHWEFSLKHEMRWLENFGLNYYGCCEPLHNKFDILDKIPNLRKISISPWADIEKSAERSKGKYVLSIKPNPAIFVENTFDEDFIRRDLIKKFEQAKGCSVEIILKDISTVRNKPQLLWQWSKIVRETIDSYY